MSSASAYLDTVPSQFVDGLSRNQNWEHGSDQPLPIVVLASGNGSNLQAILDRFRDGNVVRVVGVASNNPSAFALSRARREGIRYETFPKTTFSDRRARDRCMAEWISDRGAHLVVLAGYMEILSPEFVEQFRNRVINIHPSLLPKFPGLNSIQRAHEARVLKSGITIHFVDEGVDTGPTIKKKWIWKKPGEKLEEFESRVHAKEHELLPDIISKIACGRIKTGEFSAEEPRRIAVRELEKLQTSP